MSITEPVIPEPAAVDPVVEPPDDLGLSGDFLKGIPDADRAVVERYVKDWDSGVTKRFQSIHDEYKPYKDLGDVGEIEQAVQLRHLLDTDPEYVYNMLKQEFDAQGQKTPDASGAKPELPEYEGLPPEFVQKFTEQGNMLESLAQLVLETRNRDTETQEDEALASELKRLTTKHGDFDEEYVLAKMWNGSSGDDAVKAYQNLRQGIINGQEKPKPQPPGLFGGGVIPTDTPDVAAMSSKDTKNMVAELLARAAQS